MSNRLMESTVNFLLKSSDSTCPLLLSVGKTEICNNCVKELQKAGNAALPLVIKGYCLLGLDHLSIRKSRERTVRKYRL